MAESLTFQIRSRIDESGNGEVDIQFSRTLDVGDWVDLLESLGEKLFTAPRYFFTVEGTAYRNLAGPEECGNLLRNPPPDPYCEVAVGPDSDSNDLVYVDISKDHVCIGLDEPSSRAADFLRVVQVPYGRWKGLTGILPADKKPDSQ